MIIAMKYTAKSLLTALCSVLLFLAAGCVEVAPTPEQLSVGVDKDYEFTYGIRQFMEYDAKNPAGINIEPYFDFFKTFSLKIYVVDGKLSFLEIDNGDLPCDLYPFRLPSGKVECVYDQDVIPHVLRLVTGETLATFKDGEFIVTFSLDSEEINYKVTFKTIETTREDYEKAY